MAYRYHTPRNERQSEDDYYDWYLPRIGYVNVDRNKWFENHIRTPYKMIHDYNKSRTNIINTPEYEDMKPYIIPHTTWHKPLWNHDFIIPGIGYLYPECALSWSEIPLFWKALFSGQSPLEIYYQYGIEEVNDRKDLFDQAVHVMNILLFYAENKHLPLEDIKLCTAKAIAYGKELIKLRFRLTTQYSPERQAQMKPLIDAGIRELQKFYKECYEYLRSAGAPPLAHIELKKPIPIPQPDWYLPDEALDSGMPGHTVEYFPDPPPAESGPFRYVSLPPPERASPPPFQVDTSYSLPASRIRSREIISIPSSSSSSDISPYSEIDSDSSILPVKRARTISPAAERAVEAAAAAAVVERESSRRLPVGPPIPIDDEYHRSFDYDSQAASSSSMEPIRYLPPPPPPPPPPPRAAPPSRVIPRAVQAARSAEVATYLMESAARKARRDAYQPPSYLIGAPSNSFSNALSTLGRTGSHPDGSASHYGTYSK